MTDLDGFSVISPYIIAKKTFSLIFFFLQDDSIPIQQSIQG